MTSDYCESHQAHVEHLTRCDARLGDLEDIVRNQQSLTDRQQVMLENQQKILDDMASRHGNVSQLVLSAVIAAVIAWIPYVTTYAFPAMAH